ncbi:MAG: organic solvent tolerance protein [Bdellovibrionales bacterium]
MIKITAIFIGLQLLVAPIFAKDLTNRLGIGYSDQFAVTSSTGTSSLPSVMVMYYPDSATGMSAALGVNTKEDNSKFGLSFKYYKIIFPEDNMHFYMGGTLALLSDETSGNSSSGFELGGFVGGEYFFQGLESLGFRFEAGLGIVSVDDGVTFRTIGDSPLKAGMVFYF